MAVKVFKLNQCDWWAGEDLETVKAAYLAEMGVDSEIDNPHEVTDLELQTLKFVEGDDPVPEEGWTFKQQLDFMVLYDRKFPCFFASTEW